MIFTPAIVLAAAAYANLSWRSIGPAVAGGRVAAVAGTPQDDQLYYLGTAGGGVWQSRNGGATWQPVFDKQNVSAIGAVEIDPTNKNVVWVGTGEANPRNNVSYGDGLYKSTDGAKTWTRIGLGGVWSISRIAIDPKNPRHVVVGAFGDPFKDSSDRGVYVTFDGGTSWNKSLYLGPSSGASDVAIDPRDPSVVYAGMWQFRRVPWNFSSGGPDDGLYKSLDGGRTWKRLTGNGLPTGYSGRIGLAIAPSRPNRVFALIEAKGGILWRSDDAGAHWTMTSDDTLADQRPFYFTHIAVDPKNPNHVYAVSEMLAESKDGGKKFTEIAKGVHVDYHAIWIDPNNPKRVIVGEDGGYALTADLEHWSFSRNLAIGQIYHVGLSGENPYLVCVAFQDNGGFCGPSNSLDNEGILDRHWIDVVGGDGMWTIPDPIDPRYVWADLEDGAVTIFDRKTQVSRFIRPYDPFPGSFLGPFDLSAVPYRFNWDSPIAFAPWDGHIGWFGGNVIFQSTDRGQTWSVISPDLTRNIKSHQVPTGGPLAKDVSGAEYSDTILDIEGSPLSKGEIWVGTDDGYVQVTRDGGRALAQRYATRYAGVRTHRNGRAFADRLRYRLRSRRQPSHGRLRPVSLRNARLRGDVDEDRHRLPGQPVRAYGTSGSAQYEPALRRNRERDVDLVRRRRELARFPYQPASGDRARHPDRAGVRRPRRRDARPRRLHPRRSQRRSSGWEPRSAPASGSLLPSPRTSITTTRTISATTRALPAKTRPRAPSSISTRMRRRAVRRP